MLLLEKLSKRALVGHRGMPAKELENTLQSVQKAIETGADVVEVDIQKTRDGVLVLSHDENLKRTFGVDINIRETDWEELKELSRDRYSLARLEDALELVNGRVGMFLEVKHPEDAGAVLRVVEGKNVKDWVAVISFYPQALEPFKSKLVTGLVYAKPPGSIPEAKKLGCSIALPRYNLATQKAIDFAHKLKLFVVAWTVNEPEKAMELFTRGVDGVATDNVEELKRALNLLK
ncbi:MAG: glycerophosphodiester phosphodiesterase [Aquificaceae bacterium]|nr:glycerophosphodiester phosphodiesterase [Aquificaceae bacterium]MCS7307654.1 glycerophosphodiester phosphodiesterase [Aquificaceae bacterium]